jgi:signal transduction histidine kinase
MEAESPPEVLTDTPAAAAEVVSPATPADAVVPAVPPGAEAVLPAIPVEVAQPAPRDDAMGPAIPIEALPESDLVAALADQVEADLPPGSEEITAPSEADVSAAECADVAAEVAATVAASAAAEAAADVEATREAFFAAASHELRNPIHSLQLQLLGLTKRAELELTSPEHEWVHTRLERATAQVSQLVRLVDSFLDDARIASGRLPLILDDVDLADVVREVVGRLAHAEHAHINLVLESSVGHWDRLRLDQVVTNLVSNALKYGEGRPVDVVLSVEGTTARLAVTDRGIGIAPHHHARVFERFERVITDRRYKGFGLGLWITRRVVEELGGTIALRSDLGAGSTFTVRLPL